MTRLPSNLKPGISMGVDPVATTMLLASTRTVVAVGLLDLERVGRDEGRRSLEQRHLVGLEERPHAAGQLVDDALLPLLCGHEVDGRRAQTADPQIRPGA